MSTTDTTCEYVLDPDDPETWNGEQREECYVDEEVLNKDGVWTCPHNAENGHDLCIYHLPVTEKNDDVVVDAFIDTVDEASTSESLDGHREVQFLGARLGEFDVSGSDLQSTNSVVRMSYSTFAGSVDLTNVRIDVESLRVTGSTFEDEADFEFLEVTGRAEFNHAVFKNELSFQRADLHGTVNFECTEFKQVADFSLVEFGQDVSFEDANFRTDGLFHGAIEVGPTELGELLGFQDFQYDSGVVFGGTVDFDHATFYGDADFKNAEFQEESYFRTDFESEARFKNTTFRGDANFSGIGDLRATFNGTTDFSLAEFRKGAYFRVSFTETVEFSKATFNQRADFRGEFCERADFQDVEFNDVTEFTQVEFRGKANFSEVESGGDVDFSETVFDSGSQFENAELGGASFAGADMQNGEFQGSSLENADFARANLYRCNFERAKLSNSDMFGTDLSGAHMYAARIGDMAINTETVLDKHGESRCVYDPNSEYEYNPPDEEDIGQLRKAMGAYHVLEKLTRANTLPDKQATFFTRRQDMRRGQLREDGQRLNYWFAEAQNAIFRHGESFSRVVAWSFGTMLAFAFVYPVGGWLKKESSTGELQQLYTYDAIIDSPLLLWESFNHSALLFLTGGGALQPVGFVGEFLTTVEALIAPILLALLVFVLGRRAAR